MTPANIRVTETAASRLRTLMQEQEGRQTYLRLGVEPGGCSGMRYTMYFDDQVEPTDLTAEQHGLQVVVDAKSHLFIQGVELDFTDGLDGMGFHFNNPNAARSCGCGSSFTS